MANQAEEIKQRYGNPFDVLKAIERAAVQGYDTLTEDDLFMCKWLGLYTHRHEQGYFMLRTRQPNGYVTPQQLEVIAAITEQKNKGYADITTRQTFQLHWVHHTQAVEILKQLEAVGISTLGACGDITRNVVGCPVAGVDKDELIDGGPLVQQVNALFLGNQAYANLPRKYKISIAGCTTWCSHPEIQCVALTATRRTINGQTAVGFDLRVGGGLSTQPFLSRRLNVFVKPEDVVDVVQHITDIFRDAPEYRERRHHARFKFLIHDWGVAKFRQTLQERMGKALEETPSDVQEPADTFRDHVGVHAQKQDGLYYIGAPVLVGRITSRQMKKIADLSRRYGDGKTIRLTVRQNILLLNIAESHVEKVLAGLSDVGLSINAHPVRRSVVTCTGTEFCKLAITETKARSRQIVEYLEKRVPLEEPLRLHITGCPNACAQYQIANIGMMGSKTKIDGQVVDAYDMFVGGQMGRKARFNHAVLRKIPATECAKRLEQLLLGFKKQRKERESFNEWCERVGDEQIAALLTNGSAHPLADADDVPTSHVPEADGPVY
ncbi:MAG: nitrite/sulfite reductase [Candidatus Omnitrophica bacterium]|nr:nitrite/sulfite reductase [Candidatus Omnitrophota bacterium]